MMKRWLTGLLALVMVLALAACGTGGAKTDANSTPNINQGAQVEQSTGTGSASQSGDSFEASEGVRTEYPLTITDASGEEMTFEEAPQRIVSIAPHQTEILFALGLGDRVVGVSEYDNYPEEALTKPKVGNIQGDVEALLAVEPDLVIAGVSLNGATIKGLRDLGVRVFATEPENIDQVIESILTIGLITDAQEAAQQIAEKMRADKQYVIDKVSGIAEDQKKKVYVEYDPLWTAGKGSFLDEIITLSGGINIASELDKWAQISAEAVIAADPDVIIYAEVTDYETGNPLIETIRNRPGFAEITALKNNAVVGIDADIISRYGPRITDAMLLAAKGIYPELFSE